MGWCTSKRIQKQKTDLPLKDQSGSTMNALMSVTEGKIYGLCDLTRVKTASYDANTVST